MAAAETTAVEVTVAAVRVGEMEAANNLSTGYGYQTIQCNAIVAGRAICHATCRVLSRSVEAASRVRRSRWPTSRVAPPLMPATSSDRPTTMTNVAALLLMGMLLMA